jgi:glucose/arabinose dehydrogenase
MLTSTCTTMEPRLGPLLFVSLIMTSSMPLTTFEFARSEPDEPPIVKDSNLRVETIFEGLDFPTNMAFLDSDDILVLEKNNGTVKRIVNGALVESPVLDVSVASKDERGILGIAVAPDDNEQHRYVFVYYTASSGEKDGEDLSGEKEPKGNYLYRYELSSGRLINGRPLLDVPASVPDSGAAFHNGGELLIGPDRNLYLVVGDLNSRETQSQNFDDGPPPDGTSVIYRVTQDGDPGDGNPLGGDEPFNKYYAYGIRNSFGMDFDPVTGDLWDTENGPEHADEINLVESGFNSGSNKIFGFAEDRRNRYFDRENLVDLEGKGKYSDPEFVWFRPVGPTALKFFTSDKYGKAYENDMFVGDINNGNIYHFELNDDRTEISLNSDSKNKTAENIDNEDILFGQNFGGITDMQIGPDGNLYVLTIKQFHADNSGTIYRIVPASSSDTITNY